MSEKDRNILISAERKFLLKGSYGNVERSFNNLPLNVLTKSRNDSLKVRKRKQKRFFSRTISSQVNVPIDK